MCKESITLAICAPQNPPLLSFTCGKLHLVAGHRDVCADARGSCICFFGTCGVVERDFSTVAVDFSHMQKLRCAHCTTREDAVGDRRSPREILESPLLQRHALPVADTASFGKHRDILKALWGGESSCPYHAAPKLEETTEAGVDEEAVEKIALTPVVEVTSPKNTSEPLPAKDLDSIVPQSRTGATTPELSNSSSPQLEKVNGLEHGLESGQGLKSSRWAAVTLPEKTSPSLTPRSNKPSHLPKLAHRSPVAKPSPKLRDAAQQIATAKSFLAKKVAH